MLRGTVPMRQLHHDWQRGDHFVQHISIYHDGCVRFLIVLYLSMQSLPAVHWEKWEVFYLNSNTVMKMRLEYCIDRKQKRLV